MMKRVLPFLVVLGLLLGKPLFGWHDAGHMIVPLIAKDHLYPETRKKVDELLAVLAPAFPDTADFVRASVWGDLLRNGGLNAMSAWHFSELPYDPDHVLTDSDIAFYKGKREGEIVMALNECKKTLGDRNAGTWEKAFALRWIIHLIADIHEPLHCCTLFNLYFPKGDRGGNLYAVRDSLGHNLHMMWDAGCGALPVISYLEYSDAPNHLRSEALRGLAQEWQKQHPRNKFAQLGQKNFEAWAEESHYLAIHHAYKDMPMGGTPSTAYLNQARDVVMRQLVLAGYRLADILNESLR